MCDMQKKFQKLKEDAYNEYELESHPDKRESLSYFARCVAYSSEPIFKEKEIMVFALCMAAVNFCMKSEKNLP